MESVQERRREAAGEQSADDVCAWVDGAQGEDSTLDGNTFFVELNLTGKRQNRSYDQVDFERLYSNYHDHRDVLMPFEANVYLAEGEAKA